MICVHKVWTLIGNNYDVTGKPEKEDILVFGAGFGRLYFWRTIHIYINPSKLLIIEVHKITLVASETGLGLTLVFFLDCGEF